MSESVVDPAPPTGAAAPNFAWWLAGIFVALALLAHFVFAGQNGAVLGNGGLVNTDSYMRVLRVMELYNGAGWYDTVTPRLGAPEGLSLHWTRPVDVLILLPALFAHALGADMGRAVYWVGVSFSTICHILACLAAAWAARPLWPSPAHRFAAPILLTNASAFGYGIFGRADHHTLLLLLTTLMLGAMLRLCIAGTPPREQLRWAAIGGLYAGFGVWVSPEFMVPIVPVIGTLGLFWIDAPLDRRRSGGLVRDWAGPGAAFSLAMAAVILAAIPIEQPPAHWLVAEYDKVSFPYLVLPLTWAAIFLLARLVQGGTWIRLASGLVLAAAGAGLLLTLLPNLFFGPLGVDTRLKVDFLDTVQEMQPLWPTSLDRLRSFLPMLGQSLTTLVLLPFALRRWRDARYWAGLLVTMAFGFLLIGAVMHARLGVEFAPTAAIICAGFFGVTVQKLRGAKRRKRVLVLVLVATVLTCGPLLVGKAIPPNPTFGETCKVKDLAEWLNRAHPGIGSGTNPAPIVLTDDISYSPELAFRTDYRFVAGPYHRNAQAIFDTIDAMTDSADGAPTAKAILDRRQVSLVVRCGDVIVPRLFDSTVLNFYTRLGGRGTLPDWLTPLTLPMDKPAQLGKHFRVYEVKGR